MRFPVLAAAIAAFSLAACGDQPPQPRVTPQPAASGATSAPSTTPSSPATAQEQKDGANPVQQQVDPKEAAQRRDFQHPREGEGPTSPETQPKPGG